MSKTEINFMVNSTNHVSIELFDHTGKQVAMLADDIFQPGTHKIEADVQHLEAGHYIYRMKSGFFKDSKKLIIRK